MPDKDDESSADLISRMTDWPEKIIIGDNFDGYRPPKKKTVDKSEDPGTTPDAAPLN
jgi:hypothetical protein